MVKPALLGIFLVSSWGLAHGEKTAGPHGGYIKMPGAFHTELVPVDDKRIRVYLLDVDFKNPTVENSKISVAVLQKGKETPLQCEAVQDAFECKLTEGKLPTKGALYVLKSNRKGIAGGEARYSLPLKF